MSEREPPFSKILVANRGEIALRVFRTCRERGIRTVAVYSDGDRNAPHVAGADEAVHIGPTPSAESYLRADKIIAAAQQTGADAIHPGYGFLSERASFVEACAAAGIVFIGPGTRAMELMGDKVRARKAMIAAGVPLVPGREDVDDVEAALEAAAEIGYPLMLKASAGGGGKGMRVVHDEAELRRGFAAAKREAEAAFGDGRLFVERAVMAARHVEIQLMADAHGEVVYLNERDCSVQRRHQKVIEEAPSPGAQMTPAVRRAMGEVACRVAKAVDYVGAATVEFLFEEQDGGEPRFYFLEMNTRLQVEHPVTEMTTGRDLVWDMIRVAAGRPLGYTQAEVGLDGHAIECRIYAEDPLRFLPSPGPLLRLRWPEGPALRVDAAVREGCEVSSHYDPMIAKLVAWGPTRAVAIERMRRALEDTVVLGIECNIAFHLRVLAEPDFRAGRFDTHYIDRHPSLTSATALDEDHSRAIAAAAADAASLAQTRREAGRSDAATSREFSAWQRALRNRG
ncbi:Acetyl-/propionyl-coenzyme A carboxylase alpha chain [Enhygromyxa salina]|uniref:Acetyl-/propionyl-coenzyme A carboxylase alpha chain n=1 Tax=Enhygromyxa salina TaxID=215803 RepID=A0A2S9YDQ5_9BACT|nr:acetyl-CoA carboxylase biotin carboxylase subunit [Enhygromyxa salina]PRQ03257.1 Acetyl-/propionyl-coenzyme A carboxylase alpha chain [Enhygromyxa salina]